MIQEAWNWLRQQFSREPPPPDDDFWYEPFGSQSSAGLIISSDTAMRITTVHACVNLLGRIIGSLGCHVYERLPNGGRRMAPEHPLYYTLHDSPTGDSMDQTSMEYWESTMLHLLTRGNSYSLMTLDSRENVSGLRLLDPSRVTVSRSAQTSRMKVFSYTGDDGQQKQYTANQVFHVPGLGYDGLIGYNPIELLQRCFGLAGAAEEYGSRFFGASALPGSGGQYISHPGKISDQAANRIKEDWNRIHQGLRNSHKMGLLEEGMKIETIPVKLADLQFLELRKFQRSEICGIYGVPPHLIGDLERATFSNIENQDIGVVKWCISPWVRRIERRINMCLFGPRESQRYFCEFNLNGILRGDSASRVAYYSGLRTNGVMSANEIRAEENMNPHPNPAADELYIQGAMVPLGQQPEQQAGAKPPVKEDDSQEADDET